MKELPNSVGSSMQKLRSVLAGALQDGFVSNLKVPKHGELNALSEEIVNAILLELENFITDMGSESVDQVCGRLETKLNSISEGITVSDESLSSIRDQLLDALDESGIASRMKSVVDGVCQILAGVNVSAKLNELSEYLKQDSDSGDEPDETGDSGEADESNDDLPFTAEQLDDIFGDMVFFDDFMQKLHDTVKEIVDPISDTQSKILDIGENIVKRMTKVITTNLKLIASQTALASSNMALASSNMSLAGSNFALAGSNLSLSASNFALAGSNIVLAGAKLVLAASNLVLAVSNIGLAITVITATVSLMITIITAAASIMATILVAVGSVLVMIASAVVSLLGVIVAIVGLAAALVLQAALLSVAILAGAALLATVVIVSAALLSVAILAGAALLATVVLAVGVLLAAAAIVAATVIALVVLAVGAALVVVGGIIALAVSAVALAVVAVAAGFFIAAAAIAAAVLIGTGVMLAAAVTVIGLMMVATMAFVGLAIAAAIGLVAVAILAVAAAIMLGVILLFVLIEDLVDGVKEKISAWWEKSAIKTWWDEVQSKGGLWEWVKFKWNQSVFKLNIVDPVINKINDFVKMVQDWWEQSAIRKWWVEDVQKEGGLFGWISKKFKESWFYKEIITPIKNAIDKVVNWVKSFSFKKVAVDLWHSIQEKWNAIMNGLAGFSIRFPVGIETEKYVGIPVPTGFKWDTFHPFGFLANKTETPKVEVSDSVKQPMQSLQEGPTVQAAEMEQQSQELGGMLEAKENSRDRKQQDNAIQLNGVNSKLDMLISSVNPQQLSEAAASGAAAGGMAGAGMSRSGSLESENR